MTFTELVDEVLARTRQTSAEARERIGRAINDRNRRVTSSVGLQTSRRSTAVIVLLGGPPTLPTPAAPTITNTGTGTFVSSERYYRIRWTTKSNYSTVVARSDFSPTAAFTPSGIGAAVRIARPSPVPAGVTSWEVELWAYNDAPYIIAHPYEGQPFIDDALPLAAVNAYGTLAGQLVAVPPLTKVLAVSDLARQQVLGEVTYDQWRTLNTTSPSRGPARVYAIDTMQSTDITLRFHPWPATDDALLVDGLRTSVVLEGSLQPLFTVDFHDLLVHGALSDEWMQLKQDDLSRRSEAMYEQRLSELRMFIAKSAYLDIYQGKTGTAPSGGAYWPGYRYQGRY